VSGLSSEDVRGISEGRVKLPSQPAALNRAPVSNS
jgi:hypothetical protein